MALNHATTTLDDDTDATLDGTRLAPLPEQWWSHPQRWEYAGLVFMPGKPQELATAHGRPYYNLFRGWPVQPVPGAPQKNHLCRRRRTLPLCPPLAGARPPETGRDARTAPVLRGGQGAGKGTLVNLYGQLFGIHFQAISQMEQLLGKFNAHMQDTILVFGDEVTWGGNKQSEGA